jgi:hypothetical protein
MYTFEKSIGSGTHVLRCEDLSSWYTKWRPFPTWIVYKMAPISRLNLAEWRISWAESSDRSAVITLLPLLYLLTVLAYSPTEKAL